MSKWTPINKYAVVKHDFEPDGAYQIALTQGDRVEVLKESAGWYKGRIVNGDGSSGIFPTAFVELTDESLPEKKKKKKKKAKTLAAPAADTGTATATADSATPSPAATPGATEAGTEAGDEGGADGDSEERPSPAADEATPAAAEESSAMLKAPETAGEASPSPAASPARKPRVGRPAGPPPATRAPNGSLGPPAGGPPSRGPPSGGPPRGNKPKGPPPASGPRASLTAPAGTAGPGSGKKPSRAPPKKRPAGPPPSRAGAAAAAAATAGATLAAPGAKFNARPPPGKPPSDLAAKQKAQQLQKLADEEAAADREARAKAKLEEEALQKKKSEEKAKRKQAKREAREKEKATRADEEAGRKLAVMSIAALKQEILNCLREWKAQALSSLEQGELQGYVTITERSSALLSLRQRLLFEMQDDKKEELRVEIIHLIESSRKLQQGYIVPRNSHGEVASTDNTGVVEILDLYRDMYSTMKEESSGAWKEEAEKRQLKALKVQLEEDDMVAMPTNLRSVAKKLPDAPLQLQLDVKMCIFSVGEPTELFFSLYCASSKRFVTEAFQLQLTKEGMPTNLKLLGNMKTIFKDMRREHFEADLYLVCRIYRRGRLVFDPKKKKGNDNYRRPFGCACGSLSRVGLEDMIGQSYEPPPDTFTIYTPGSEGGFATLHERIIAGAQDLQPAPRAKGIAVALSLHPGELDDLFADDDEGIIDDDAPITRQLAFPKIIKPQDHRNDFYCQIQSGKFAQDKKKSQKNVEVRARVVLDNGEVMKDCIVTGSGDNPPLTVYSSSVLYHNNTPCYNEDILLRVDPELFSRCHLLFTYSHVSSSKGNKSGLFSYSFLKLATQSGAVIPDQPHVMTTYKPFKNADTDTMKAFYLNAAGSKLVARKESFTVSSRLLSTKKTQNDVLHSLFKWKILDTNSLLNCLNQFTKINRTGVVELAKFVRELFDVFFQILSSDAHKQAHEHVFSALLHSLALLADKKLQQYQALVKAYIRNIFNDPFVHNTLVRLCQSRLESAQSKPDQNLTSMTKCFNYVIKFIVASRQQDLQQAQPSVSPDEFRQRLLVVMDHLNGLVAQDAQGAFVRFVLPAQSYIVRSFPEALDELAAVFAPAELGFITQKLIESIPDTRKQDNNRMQLLANLLTCAIGKFEESRDVVFPIILQATKAQLMQIDSGSLNQPYLCVAILQRMLSVAANEKFPQERMDMFAPLLGNLCHVVLQIQRFKRGEVELVKPVDTILQYTKVDMGDDSMTVLLTILHLMSKEQLDGYLASLGKKETRAFMATLLQVLVTALSSNHYPEMWVVMNMLLLTVTSKVVAWLAPWMKRLLLKEKHFAFSSWKLYFDLSLSVLGHDYLQLERFSSKKATFVRGRYGDVREPLLGVLRDTWDALGEKRLRFIDVVVRKLFDIAANTEHEPSKELALELYFDMVQHEYFSTGEFNRVERHTIDALYGIADTSQESGHAFMQLIYTTLEAKFKTKPELMEPGMGFLDHVQRMYELMASLLKFPDTALFEDERTSVAIKLLTYLESSRHVRKQMYSHYVQYLVDLHVSLQNHCEAACTQLLQVRMLEWQDDLVPALGQWPEEPERDRKEKLYGSAISYFRMGQEWERAIAACDELRAYYEHVKFDYENLGTLLTQQAQFYKRVLEKERFFPNYFRVVYHGAFDADIAEQEFVYRGIPLEPVMDFTNRLKKKFPQAHILMSSDKPNEELSAKHEQIISITTLVKPSMTERKRLELEFTGKQAEHDKALADRSEEQTHRDEVREASRARYMPKHVSKYLENTDLRVFAYGKAVQKAKEKKPDNEFKHLWVLKTYVFLAESFPTKSRRLAVVGRKEVMIRPIQNAINTMIEKNQELLQKVAAVQAAPEDGPVDVGPLSMNLNGMIDAAVNGGTQKYIEAFISKEFLDEHPDEESLELQQKLRDSLGQQIKHLKVGLDVFGSRATENLKGLHEHLTTFYKQMVKQTQSVVHPPPMSKKP